MTPRGTRIGGNRCSCIPLGPMAKGDVRDGMDSSAPIHGCDVASCSDSSPFYYRFSAAQSTLARRFVHRRSHPGTSRLRVGTRGRFRSIAERMRLPTRPVTAPDSTSLRSDVAEQHIHGNECGAVQRHGRSDAVEEGPLEREINGLRSFPYATIRNHDWIHGPNALDAAHKKSVVCVSTSS